jgi:RNA polymerase sigma-70 factor (ECF subfamily)
MTEPLGPINGADAVSWIVSIADHRDRGSFRLLFSHYAPRVKAYLLQKGVADPVAEELTQEALLTVWRKAGQFDCVRASPSAWVYTIARNLWIDAFRHERQPDDGCVAEAPGPQLTPEELLKVADGEERLRAAMRILPPEQAEVLHLSFFEEQTHAQIADTLRLPVGTVKSRIRLATAHLRRTLEDQV